MPQTGPKTAEGRRKSSQNARKHGLSAATPSFLLSTECEEKWDHCLNVWTNQLEPHTEAEFIVVADIAHADWNLRRCRADECALLDMEMVEQAAALDARYEHVDNGMSTAAAFKGLADGSRSLDLLHRYATRHRRAIDRGLATLRTLRAMTADQPPQPASSVANEFFPNEIPHHPSGPDSQPQAEQNTIPSPANVFFPNEIAPPPAEGASAPAPNEPAQPKPDPGPPPARPPANQKLRNEIASDPAKQILRNETPNPVHDFTTAEGIRAFNAWFDREYERRNR